MNLPHPNFCVLPWISLETGPTGTVRPCCLADDEIVDNNGNKFELSTADFAVVQNSNYMRQLREEFLAGEKPKTCRKCWNEEQSGRTSKRMHTLNRHKNTLKDEQGKLQLKEEELGAANSEISRIKSDMAILVQENEKSDAAHELKVKALSQDVERLEVTTVWEFALGFTNAIDARRR
jgi:hypothetical protein